METIPVCIGNLLQDASGQPWEKVNLSILAERIKNPDTSFIARISALRSLREIDIRKYANQKRNLPYFILAEFEQDMRRLTHLQKIHGCIFDFDHLPVSNQQAHEVRDRLAADKHIYMSFISPGGDGVKAVCVFDSPIQDSHIYTSVHRNFLEDLAKRYGLKAEADARTHDATRVCFMSYDPELKVNSEFENLPIHAWCNTMYAIPLFDSPEHTSELSAPEYQKSDKALLPLSPSQEKLRELLNPGSRPIKTNPHPDIHELLIFKNALLEQLPVFGLELTETINIQYGIKIKVHSGVRHGEINVFYGKQGFRPVASPRKGTDKELNQALLELAFQIVSVL